MRGVGPMGRSRGVGQPGPNAAGVSYRRKAKDSGGVTVGLLMVTEYDRRVATVYTAVRVRWGWGCQTRNGSTHDYIVDREQRLHTQSECSPGVQSTTPSHVPYRTVRRGPGCSDQCVQKPNKRDREKSTFKFAGHAHYNNVHCRARGRTSNIQFGASWYGTANPSQFASGRSHSTPLTALRVS